MRHTPCGCRSAHLVEVRSNSRLSGHSTMRRAQQCRYFASSLPPSKRHSRLTTVRRGCCQVATRRDSWRSHVHRTYTAQRVQPFKPKSRNVGGRGAPLAFLWGIQRGYSLRKENTPFGAAARTPLPLRTRAKKRAILSRENLPLCPVQRRRRCPPPALSCRKSKSDGFFSRRFSICITAKPFCCRGWPSCAALC